MLAFLTDLWESVFTPGTTPTLVLATHVTFALLVVTLSVFAFLSKSIHLINLLVLSLLLWGILTWFISEIDKIQDVEEKVAQKEKEKKEEATAVATTTATTRKRKV